MEPSVVVDGVSKTYRLYQSPWHRAAELFARRPLHRPSTVLQQVTFELRGGERLGIVGENGAGKSTLLKILAGVTAPSSGRAEVRGRVASILELGSGFHPELTGRQNVALNAAMLGLSEEDLTRRLPDIVAFSELGQYIDQPVKSYSTGMAMRLAFSIATQVDPEVLIIDEALSVGDGYFQKKCLDRILELCDDHRILLFCSHAMYYVTSLCTRALWLRRGEVAALGPALDVVRAYEGFLQEKHRTDREPVEEAEGGPARLLGLRQLGGGQRRASEVEWGLQVSWESDDPSLGFHLAVGIDRSDGVQVCSFATNLDRLSAYTGRRQYEVELDVPRLPIRQGTFSVHVFLLDVEGLHVYDHAVLAEAFSLQSSSYYPGIIAVEHRWREHEPALDQRDSVAHPAIQA